MKYANINFFTFFDYIFYRLASFYENFGYEERFYAISLLSIIQCSNILTLISLFYIFSNKTNELSPLLMLILGISLFIILNSIRYRKVNKFYDLKMKWSKEVNTIKFKRGFYIILYFILSFIILVLVLNLAKS